MSTMPRRTATTHESTGQIGRKFAYWAVFALIADLATKEMAVRVLANQTFVLSDWFSFLLVFNTGAAGGVSLGPYTWLINILATLFTVALVSSVVVPLTRVDSRAVLAMGLIAGGAAGNLTSLAVESRGVPDFLAMQIPNAVVVFNIADVALWAGAAVLMPVTLGLVRAVRDERRAKRLSKQAATA